MPFSDEARPVEVVPYRAAWPGEFGLLAERLARVLEGVAVSIDHIGSASVPGLTMGRSLRAGIPGSQPFAPTAKDVIDVQVRVVEVFDGGEFEKLAFAPPVGERHSNVHVRVIGEANTRAALLFRDFLRAHDDLRDA